MATDTTRKGLPDGYTRWTLIVDEELAERVREIAFYKRQTAWQVVEAALRRYCETNKKIPSRVEEGR